jgi:hypothetical protein
MMPVLYVGALSLMMTLLFRFLIGARSARTGFALEANVTLLAVIWSAGLCVAYAMGLDAFIASFPSW